MNLHKLILKNNDCYKAGRTIVPKGIMVHSTGANNPWLQRYVNPDDGLLGTNRYGNHWNRSGVSKCVHAFIGMLDDGTIATYQTLPWNHRAWHAGDSANNTHISFEICEDGLQDVQYFKKVYAEAVDLCVYLCKQYDLTEKDILCHSEGAKLGIASSHTDVMHWFPKHGKSMDTFRADVKAKLQGTTTQPETPAKTDTKIDTVKEVQTWLNKTYSSGLSTDGEYGRLTRTALTKALQKELGVTADGVYGPKTNAAVKVLKKGSTGSLVKVLQAFLVCNGYTSAYADGNFGTGTQTALKQYQKVKGLDADGMAGPQTFKSLCNG